MIRNTQTLEEVAKAMEKTVRQTSRELKVPPKCKKSKCQFSKFQNAYITMFNSNPYGRSSLDFAGDIAPCVRTGHFNCHHAKEILEWIRHNPSCGTEEESYILKNMWIDVVVDNNSSCMCHCTKAEDAAKLIKDRLHELE